MTEYRGKGIGTEIVNRLIDFVKNCSLPKAEVSLCFMCAQGKEGLYEKISFGRGSHEHKGAGCGNGNIGGRMNMALLKKAEEIINRSTMHTVGESGCSADWVMALTDEEGYPAASMITAARADGFKWIAFCTGLGWNKPNRAEKDPRACVYLFDKNSFSGISLTGKIEVVTDLETKRQMWYDALDVFFENPEDEALCVLVFLPERYNIFIDGHTIRGVF